MCVAIRKLIRRCRYFIIKEISVKKSSTLINANSISSLLPFTLKNKCFQNISDNRLTMSESDHLEVVRANIVKVLTSCPSGVYLTEFQQKYLEASGSQLLPRILGFENLETLLNMLVEDIVQLDYDVEDILVKLKEDKPSECILNPSF